MSRSIMQIAQDVRVRSERFTELYGVRPKRMPVTLADFNVLSDPDTWASRWMILSNPEQSELGYVNVYCAGYPCYPFGDCATPADSIRCDFHQEYPTS